MCQLYKGWQSTLHYKVVASICIILDLSNIPNPLKRYCLIKESILPNLVPCLGFHAFLSSLSIVTLYSYPFITLTRWCKILHTQHIPFYRDTIHDKCIWDTNTLSEYMNQQPKGTVNWNIIFLLFITHILLQDTWGAPSSRKGFWVCSMHPHM
jgi:hypothetical protein